MNKNSKIYVAGHNGMVGSSIIRILKKNLFENLVTKDSKDLDLRDQSQVEDFFQSERPEIVVIAAAKVGGIQANNTFKAEFIYDNLMIEANIIHSAYKYGVQKLLNLGSSCIYPKNAKQPLKEEYLLSGYLEPTNQPYAIAKITGIELCNAYREQYGCNFISAMPTNLFGPNDNYDLNNSHVIPALIRKFIEAKKKGLKEVIVWGSGYPRRDFLHVDELADACLFLLQNYDDMGHINIGSGKDYSIRELAEIIKSIVGYENQIIYDNSKPDGTLKKLLDITKISDLGWAPTMNFEQSIKSVIEKVYTQF